MPVEPFIGILMLDGAFRRFPGDIGNAETWRMPVRFRHVSGATPRRIVGVSDESFLEPFVEAGRALVEEGAIGISTSCGYLAFYQREMADRLPVPVLTSSLALYPLIASTLASGRRIGILTFDDEKLLPSHLAAVGINDAVPIQGLPKDGRFQRAILGDDVSADSFEAREEEALWAASKLVREHPGIGAILCECTNLGPHSAAIAARTGLPVHDIVSALEWFHAGLRPRAFAFAGA